MLKMFSRVLRVQWYTFFDPPTTVAYKNLILTKYTNIEKCGGEKRKTISVCPRALHCQTKFWLHLKETKFLSHKWSLLEALVLETERKLILIFLTNGRFQLKGTPQKKNSFKLFKNRLIGFRRVENYFFLRFYALVK